MAEIVKKKAKKTKKHRKHGRSKVSCAVYRASHRRERNKLRRVNRHLLAHPGDKVAVAARTRLKMIV